MIRGLLYVLAIVAVAAGLSWLADRPGELVINWQGYEVQTSVFRAIVMAGLLAVGAIVVWSVIRQLLTGPANVGQFFRRRRQEKGLEALSSGLIAVGSGDRALAKRFASEAHRSLPHEPLTHLLRAQAAQLTGDRATARRIYESMRNNPETELLGLRGLYLEAQHEDEPEAARQYAERAVALNPRLGWSVESLFEMQCKEGNWQGALDTMAKAGTTHQVDKRVADRRRAVLLTAQAVEAEESDAARAMALAIEAHGLAPELVPAAAVAGRLLASQGATPRAAKILQRTWRRGPHPDIAAAYAYARIGDSPRDRLARVRELAALTPHNDEGQIAVATAAIDAQEWETARRSLQHLVAAEPSRRICTLMARIEGGQHGDTGKVREWLARAVHAARDPAWVADGHVSSRWSATSQTGALDVYVWQQPVDTLERLDTDLLMEQLAPAQSRAGSVDQLREARVKAIEVHEIEPPQTAGPTGAETAKPPAGAPGTVDEPAARPIPPKSAATDPVSSPAPSATGPAASASPDDARAQAATRGNGATPSTTAPAPAPAMAQKESATTSRVAAPPLRSEPSSAPDARATTADRGATPVAASFGSGSAFTRMQAASANRSPTASGQGSSEAVASLRAPDDPGPDAAEPEEVRGHMTRFRVPSKGA